MRWLYASLLVFMMGCTYDYEVCDGSGQCSRVLINPLTYPSAETENVCVSDFEEAKKYGATSECEDVPVNRLLSKEGTDKQSCSDAPYLQSHYVDNWWNSQGLIDECEMPPSSDMQFIFKRHDQKVFSHTGKIQVTLDVISYKGVSAMQVFSSGDANEDNLPDEWVHCGNVDGISGYSTKVINCEGEKLKFIKLVNAPWNEENLYLDSVEVLKVNA